MHTSFWHYLNQFLILGCSVLSLNCYSQQPEEIALKNVRQLTFPEMGFARAGEAYFSPDDKSIIFQAIPYGKSHYQIYYMNLDEATPFLISTGKGACTCAYFHPKGHKIIFASSHENPQLHDCGNLPLESDNQSSTGKYKWDLTPYMNIYQANLDGSNLIPLTSGSAYHAECAYSPDGSKIVFSSNQDGSMNLYTMDEDGSNVEQITHTFNCYNGGPFFSPDGKRIVFRADREKPDYLQLYLINSDGTNEEILTSNEAVNWAPYWHPNGKIIAYTTSIHGHHQYEIYLMNVETQVPYRLTYNPTFDGLPVFSHDGNKILWTSKRGVDGSCQIFIADFEIPPELN